MTIKWGIFLVAGAPPGEDHSEVLQNTLSYAKTAEELGFDDAWVLEHHFTGYGICGAPLAMAAYVLGQTTRLRVGTAVSVVPLQHPLRLAESVSLLDNLSGGRFMYGIGRGQFVKDYKIFGVDMESNREMMAEATDIMLRAWRDGHCVSEDGKYYKFQDVQVMPRIFTKPHPPVYAAVMSPGSIGWAAKRAIPMLLSHFQDDEARLANIELYSEMASEHGVDPDGVDHILTCFAGTGDTTEQMHKSSHERLRWWQDEYFRATELFTADNIHMRGYEWYARNWEKEAISGKYNVEARIESDLKINPIGSVQKCIDILARTVEITGVKHYVCGFESISGGRTAILESMQRFKEEVVPNIPSPTKRFGA
jgi:alkanal monooxygenase alpha chain